MKFIADAMLGRLARWLRILGFDVLYFPDIEDRQVVRLAREEDRTVLTRDAGLSRRKGIRALRIESEDIDGQLRELRGVLDFQAAAPLMRCADCNGLLTGVATTDEVRDLVPDFVFHNAGPFARCEKCGKVYWEGTHYREIRNKIGEIFKETIED